MYQNNNGYYQPGTGNVPPQPPYPPYLVTDPEVESLVDDAFGKSLAATIMCGFPVASIIAISFGNTGLNLVERAKILAAQRGIKPSGKNVAAQILGKIGKIAGIVMTIFWGIYLFMIFTIMLAAL